MPTLSKHQSLERLVLLGEGDPSTGKTGSLAELINNMGRFGLERVVIHDWDDGLDVLQRFVKPEFQERVFFETLRDELKPVPDGSLPEVRTTGDVVTSKRALAWPRGMTLMNNWKTKEYDLGPALTWGKETLFVCDTLTGMGDAAMNYAQVVLGIPDRWRATARAMELQERYTQLCISLKCHFIMFSHIRFMGGGGRVAIEDKNHPGTVQYKEMDSDSEGTAYPSALGKILPPRIARNFNTVLEWHLQGNRRFVRTEPKDRIPLKLPISLKANLDQRTALVEVFSALLKK